MTDESRKAINFDLDTKALKQYYPKKGFLAHLGAYKDIEKFLLKNGFSHRQWSGYVSKEPMPYYSVADVINNLSKKYSWLSKCVNKFDVTEIGVTYDLTQDIHNAAKQKGSTVKEKHNKRPKKSMSNMRNLSDKIKAAQKDNGISKDEKPKSKNKNDPSL
ncbi:MAG: vapd [Firmicutes bacterium]|nr:vapd [Bacillota bacterium]